METTAAAVKECGGVDRLRDALDLWDELQGNRRSMTAEQLLAVHRELPADDLRRQIENELVERHRRLVASIANRQASRVPIAFDELFSAGLAGVLDAIRKFDPAKRVAFGAFATQKAGFAMLDYCREVDHQPRAMRTAGGGPNSQSLEFIAEQTMAEFEDARDARGEFVACHRTGHPGGDASRRRFVWRLLKSIERETALAIALQHLVGMSQASIAELLGVSPSRISQMVKAGFAQLRDQHGNAADVFDQLRAANRGIG